MKKVWIYENILDSVSNEEIERRLTEVRGYAVKNNLTVVGESIDRHTLSAYSWDAFAAAVDALKRKNADTILVPHLMTFGKETKTISEKICEIAAVDASILSVKEGYINPLVTCIWEQDGPVST